jgi:uncharacterized membrane protein
MAQRIQPLRPLLTGVLALLPLAATILLLAWSWGLAAEWLGPGSAIGRLLTRIGLGVAADSPLPGYPLGLMVILALVYLFGLLVEIGLQRGLDRAVKALVRAFLWCARCTTWRTGWSGWSASPAKRACSR